MWHAQGNKVSKLGTVEFLLLPECSILLTNLYTPVVKIKALRSDGSQSIFSGVVVGANDILTAAHPLASDGSRIVSISVYPSYTSNPSDNGALNAVGFTTLGATYTNNIIPDFNVNSDIAVISLATVLGFTIGAWGLGAPDPQGLAYIAGYPGTVSGKPNDQLIESNGKTQTLGADFSNVLDISNIYTSPGSSGSPVYIENANGQPTIIGIVSTVNWAANLSTDKGSDTLTAVRHLIAANNLYIAGSLPRLSTPDYSVVMGKGVTSISVKYPISLSFPISLPVNFDVQATSLSGTSMSSLQTFQIPAGSTSKTLTLNLPLNAQSLNLSFTDADNALFNALSDAQSQPSLLATASLNVQSGAIGGSDLSESVVLSSANDSYRGGGGDDTLMGGGGIDTAYYSGTHIEYSLQIKSNTCTVSPNSTASNQARSDGIDSLQDFERLSFKDGTLALDIQHLAPLLKGASALFGWSTMPTGILNAGVTLFDAGVSLDEIWGKAMASTEYRFQQPKFFMEEQLTGLIKMLYLHTTNALPTAEQINFWLGEVNNGHQNISSLIGLASNLEGNLLNMNWTQLQQIWLG